MANSGGGWGGGRGVVIETFGGLEIQGGRGGVSIWLEGEGACWSKKGKKVVIVLQTEIA